MSSVITTERLILRRFQQSDMEDVTALIRDKMKAEFAPYDNQWPTADEAMKGTLDYFVGDDSWFAVELISEKRVIGFVAVNKLDDADVRNFGYTIHTSHKRRGYAYEACTALIEHCKNKLGVKRLTAGTAECNIPSVRLLGKLGFVKLKETEVSFVKDKDGKAVVFVAGEYELVL
jgi:RimJ/RimL family protein N-acetyltransferase